MSELDISLLLVSPDGETVLSDYKQSRGDHRLTALQAGDYKLCLSNKFSFLSSKTVNLEVLAAPEDEADDLAGLSSVGEETPDSHIESQLRKIKDWLAKASHLQDRVKHSHWSRFRDTLLSLVFLYAGAFFTVSLWHDA